jgi:hypothetical protein
MLSFPLFLAISDPHGKLSLVGQLVAIAVAFGLGRFALRSRAAIALISFAGACGAMVAKIAWDGQGAFLLLVLTPVVYLAAIAGRRDLDGT